MREPVCLALVAGSVALSLSCGGASADVPPQGGDLADRADVPVETLRLVAQDFDEQFSAPGLVEAREHVTLSAELAGRVERMTREIGSTVRRGELLVALDDRAQKAQVQRLDAEVERATTQLAWAQRELERQERLYADEIAAARARDEAQRQVDLLRGDLAAKRADLEIAKVELERTRIRAPLDAAVARRLMAPGEYVTPGTALYELVAAGSVKFVFSVAEGDVIGLQDDQEIALTLDARRHVSYTGRIAGIAPAGAPGTRTYRVELVVENPPDAPLLAGMSGRAEVVRKRHRGVFLVPESALLREADRSYLYLVEDQRARRAEVEVISQSGSLAVLSSDLRLAPDPLQRENQAGHEANPLGSAAVRGELQAILLGQAAVKEGSAVRVRRIHDAPPQVLFD